METTLLMHKLLMILKLVFLKTAQYCESKNYKICIVGSKLDSDATNLILKECKNVIDMIDKSPPGVIYSLALKSNQLVNFNPKFFPLGINFLY